MSPLHAEDFQDKPKRMRTAALPPAQVAPSPPKKTILEMDDDEYSAYIWGSDGGYFAYLAASRGGKKVKADKINEVAQEIFGGLYFSVGENFVTEDA